MAEGISLDQFMTLPAKTAAPAKGISIDDFMKLPAASTQKAAPPPTSRGFLGEVTNNFMRTMIRENPKLAGNALEGLAEVLEPDDATRAGTMIGSMVPRAKGEPPQQPVEQSTSRVRELAASLQEFGKQGEKESQPAVSEFLKIRTDSLSNMGEDALAWLGQAVGQAAGSSAPSIVAGLGTAAVTKNPIAGFIAGAFGPSYLQNFGDTYGAMRDDKDIQAAVKAGKITQKKVAEIAAAWSVPMAALDAIPEEKIFGASAKELKGNLLKRAVKRAGIGAVMEAPAEGLQQVLQEAAIEVSGGQRTLKQQATSVFENFIAGGVGGAPIAALRPGPEAGTTPPPPAVDTTVPPPPGGVPPGAASADTIIPQEEPPAASAAATVTDYSVETEDVGTLNIRAIRDPDGSVALVDTKDGHIIKNNAAFANSKSDIDLIAYAFEPLGYKGAVPVAPAAPATTPKTDRLTPDDHASPIPNDVIDAGKALVEDATGKPSTVTTTEVVDGHRRVVDTPVATIVAKDRAETAALISQVTAGVGQPEIAELGQQPAPPAAGTVGGSVPTPAPPAASVAPPVAAKPTTFKPGPDGYRYRVSRIGATGGGLMLEKRSSGGDISGFYVGADGDIFNANEVVFNRPETIERVWKPQSPEAAAAAMGILDEMGAMPLNLPERAVLKQRLKDIVLGEAGPAAPSQATSGDNTRQGATESSDTASDVAAPSVAPSQVFPNATPDLTPAPIEDVSDDAHPRSEDTSSFAEFVAKSKAHIAAREAKAKEIADRGGSTRMEHQTREGQKALVGPDMAEPGKFRITRFDKQGPFGHTTFNTLEEAANEALRDGYIEVAQPEVLSEPVKQTALKDKIEAKRGAAAPAQAPRPETRPIRDDVATTATGRDVPVTYAVIEADDLIASQRDEGGANPAYPQELQPRDRSRGSSDQQINKIAQNLDPRLLDKNPNASDGAPIISEDGVVESGNGRVLAVRRAYGQGLPTAEKYRQYLADQGYPVDGMRQPVLVRVRKGELDDRAAFTREANERTTLAMSEPEQAMADAKAMPDATIALYRGGEITDAGNRDFVRSFMQSVVNPNERQATATGELSQQAIRRVRAALLARAYGAADLVSALVESTDNNIKAIGGALMDVAGQWAQMRAEAAKGTINPDVDVTKFLLEAVRLIQRARNEGRPIAEFVAQTDIFSGTTIVPEAEMLLRLMFRNNASWTQPVGQEKLADALSYYVAEARKTSAGVDLLGETAPPAHKILAQAKARQYGAEETQAKLALGNRTAGPNDGAPAGERAVEAKSGPKPESRPAVPGKNEGKAPSKLAKKVAAVRAKLKGKVEAKRPALEQHAIEEIGDAAYRIGEINRKAKPNKSAIAAIEDKIRARLATLPKDRHSAILAAAHQLATKRVETEAGKRRAKEPPERKATLPGTQTPTAAAAPVEAPVARAAPTPPVAVQRDVSPDALIPTEKMQNRLKDVEAAFPEGDGYTPIVAVSRDDGLHIIDGHNRAAVAKKRGDTLDTVTVQGEAYDRAVEAGFEPLDIAHAALEMAGEGEAASQLRQQFPGAMSFIETEAAITDILEAEPRQELSDELTPEELLHSEGPQVLALGTVHKKIGSLREKYERFEQVKLRAKIMTDKVQALIARMNAIPLTDLEDGTGPYKEFGKFSRDPNAPWWKNRLRVYNFGTAANPVRAKDIDELHARMEDRANRLAIDDVNKVRKQEGLPPLPHYTPEIGHHAVIVIGLPGSGKSTISNNAAIENQAAVVDIDNAKEIIPEYYDPKTGRGGIGANAVHQESGELNWETLQRMAHKGVNMVIPRVGQSSAAIEQLRQILEVLGYTIELHYMAVTPTTAADRMLSRAEETERLINPEWFLSIIREPGKSYETLKKSGKFDGYAKIRSDNNPATPTSVTEAFGPDASVSVGDIIERNGTTRRVGPPQRGSNAARTQDVRGKREGLKAWEPAPLKLTEAQRLEDIQIDNELLDDPDVAEAEEKIEKLASTADEKGYDTPEWWGKRLYNFGAQKLGEFEAIQRFISGARRLATNEINQGRAKLGLAPLPHYQVANNREAVILMGVTGAGKSSIANPIAYRMKAAIPDVDEYKKAIPGYDGGLGATAVHPESHKLGLRVLEQLLDEGANVVIQTVGDAYEKIEGHRRRLVSKGYTVHLAVMDPPPRTALQRMVARFKRTGRLIPRSVFMKILRQPPHIYKHAKKLGRFDSYARVYSDNVSLSRVTEATAGVSPVAAGETFNQDGTIGSRGDGGRSGNAQRGQSGSQEIGNRPEGGQRRDELSTHVEPIKGGQAVYRLRPEYQAKAAAVLRDLQAEINRLAPGVPVRVWETIRNLINGKDIAVTGQYLNGVIDVALASKDPELTLYHEVVHALWDTFTPAEQAILTRKSNREWRERYDIARKYGTATEEIQIEEGVAAAITDWKRGARMDGVVAKAFKRIMAILRALGSAFTKNGIRSAEDIFADIESGKIGQRLAQQQTYRKLHPLEVRAEVTRKIPDARPLPANVEARVRQADNETTPALENAIREFTLWSRDGERLNEGKMAEHVRNGFGELEEAARGNNLALAAEIEQNFAPVREFMRKQFGDTVKLYRKQRQVAAGKSRAMLSWSYDPAYAWQHMPAHKEGAVQEFVVHAADVPLEHIVWATNRGGEVEFILHNDPKNEVSVDTTGKLVVKPKPTTETVNMFEGPREQFVLPGAEKISQKSLFQRQAEMKMQPKKGQKSVGDLPLFSDQKDQMSLFEVVDEGPPNESAPRFELNAAPHGTQQAQQVQQGFLARGQWIDRAVRLTFDLLGGLDEKNIWRPSKRLGDKLGITPQRREAASVGGIMGAMAGGILAGPAGVIPGAIAGGTVGTFLLGSPAWTTDGRFNFMRSFAENAKRGLITNYGLDPEYVATVRRSNLGAANIARQAEDIMKVLHQAGVTPAEAEVLKAIIEGEPVNDAKMTRLAVPIREAIDALGAEMVQEGLISAESFERNRGAYLHRVYAKHEADTDSLSGWVAKKMATRRKKIIGDELKGRGIFMDIANDRLMRDVDSFKSAARGGPVKGEKFRVVDEVSTIADLVSGKNTEKVLRRVYLPAGEAVPAKYQGEAWVDRGTWEARQVSDGKTVLWRDYTKEERGKMGEIVDARYGIAKTFMLASNDIATGKFFREVSQREEWARSMPPPDGTWKEGGEYNAKNGRFWEDPNIQWVKVPDGNIPKTNTKRWGALAGKFVRAEIWRDLNEINLQHTSTTWRVLMAQWKKNKTGRNPVVHLNNIMSNLVWMDLADVRAQDLYRGIKAYFSGNADYIEARDNGAFGSDMVAQDLRQNVLKPILDEISQQSTKATQNPLLDWTGIPFLRRAKLVGVLADKLWSWAKWADNGMLRAYQAEDAIFRMAAYLRRRSQGEDAATAAMNAKDQFLDYDIRAPWVVAAKNSMLPFISYTYRAVPKLMENIQNRPWKLIKYVTLAAVANSLAYLLDDGDDDDDKKRGKLLNREQIERAGLRDEEQGYVWWIGSPRMIRMPYRDNNGLPVFLDIRRWVPAGDVFDMEQGNGAVPIPAPLLFGGPLQIAMELRMNRSAFTGDDITNSLTQTPLEKASATADYAWKAWAPNSFWSPSSWYWTRISDAIYGVRDKTGNITSVPQAVLSAIGIKAKSVDYENGTMWHYKDFQDVQNALKTELRRAARDLDRGKLDQAGFDSEAAKIMRKFENLSTKIEELDTRTTPRRAAR